MFRSSFSVLRNYSNIYQINRNILPCSSLYNRLYSSSIDWASMKKIYGETKFSFPELESLLVQYERRRSDKSRNLSKEEFGKFLGPLGIDTNPETVDRYYKIFDTNNDGICFKELVTSLSTFLRGSPEEVAALQFKTWDIDNNGELDENEFLSLLKSINRSSLSDKDIEILGKSLFTELDVDNNGSISLSEFKLGMLKSRILTPNQNFEKLSGLSDAETDVLSLIGSHFTLSNGKELQHSPDRAIYFILDGEINVNYGGISLLNIKSGSPKAFIGEVCLFTSNDSGRDFYASAIANGDTKIMAVKISDLLPLILHDHKGTCKLTERLGGLLFDRLQHMDQLLNSDKYRNHLPEDQEQFTTFRKSLTAAWALRYHTIGVNGKLSIVSSKTVGTAADLSVAYSPGVAEPCLAIKDKPERSYDYTSRGHLVGVVSNGTAVLGLGNIGALASKPVMEGKAILFKKFGFLDSFDIEVNETDPQKFIDIVCSLEPTFGGINLEDIKAPECFYIEKEIQKRMNIPIMHDDQHGTAIIAGAGLLNALELVNKNITDIKVVVSGCGAAGFTCAKYFISLGVLPENLIACDINGVVHKGREDLKDPNNYLNEIATESSVRTLNDAIVNADVFFGLSVGGLLKSHMLKSMNRDPLVFAMANPNPEISYYLAKETRDDVIMGTGRSDFPNQINNVCAFPYIFRGAIDCRATEINLEMKKAATEAIAILAKTSKDYTFGREYIIPKPFDIRLLTEVAPAVANAAIKMNIAKKELDIDQYKSELEEEQKQLFQ